MSLRGNPHKWTKKEVEQFLVLYNAGTFDRQIAAQMGLTVRTILGLRMRLRLPGNSNSILLPVPSDFLEIGPTLKLNECCRHYGHSERIIKRWYAESGITFKPRFVAKPPKPKLVPKKNFGYATPTNFAPLSGEDEEAAHYLRRWYSPVFRSRTIDKQAPRDEWRCGSKRVKSSELIRLAHSKGLKRWEEAA